MKHPRLSLVALLAPALATALTSSTAHASKEIGIGVTYDARAPLGGFRDLVPNVAVAGLQAKWDYFPLDALSIGLEAQYHLFQRGLETSTSAIPNGTINAPTYRFATIWSFLPTVRYYLAPGALRPYVALGTGVTSTVSGLLVSDLSRREEVVAFIVQPSVGVLWRLWSDLTPDPAGESLAPVRRPIESMFGLTASATYAFTTADVVGANNVSYAGIQVGIYAKP